VPSRSGRSRARRLDQRVLLVAAERHRQYDGDILHDRRCLDRHQLHVPLDNLRLPLGNGCGLADRPVVLVVRATTRRSCSPTYHLPGKSIPKLALAPLIILVFGIGLASKVAVATRTLRSWSRLLTAYAGRDGARSRQREAVLLARRLAHAGVSASWSCRSACRGYISVLRVNIGLALTGAIVGEFIASQHGLGRQILYAGQTYDIALVWGGGCAGPLDARDHYVRHGVVAGERAAQGRQAMMCAAWTTVPFVPAKRGPRVTNTESAGLGSRFRGNERGEMSPLPSERLRNRNTQPVRTNHG